MANKNNRNSSLPKGSGGKQPNSFSAFLKRKENIVDDDRVVMKDLFDSPWSLTTVNILCNPNIKVDDSTKYEELRKIMRELFVVELKDQDVINEIFGHKPLIKEVRFGTAGIEIGKRHKLLHVHLHVSIEHKVKKYSMVKLCARLKAWLDDMFHIPGKPYWYVHGERGGKDTAHLNYNNKELRDPASEKMKSIDPEETDRLSSYLPRVRKPDKYYKEQWT